MDDDLDSLDMEALLGIDWGDVGRNVFGGVHTAGKVLATGFGGSAGASLADSAAGLEEEGGLLPDWAKPKKPNKPNTPGASPSTATPRIKATLHPVNVAKAASAAAATSHPIAQALVTQVPSGLPTKTPRTSTRLVVETVAATSVGLGFVALIIHLVRRRA